MLKSRNSNGRRGIAATELAMLMPFLMLIAVLVVDFGRVFYYTVTIQYSARDGAYYASDYPGIYSLSTVWDAAIREAVNLDGSDLTVTCYSATSASGSWTQYARYVGPTPTVTGGPTGKASEASGATHVKVEVSYNFRMVTTYFSWIATDGDKKFVITRSVIMAVAPIVPG